MSLGDILFDREIAPEELRDALAEVCAVAVADILVVDDVAAATFEHRVEKHIRMLCERTLVQGEFQMLLSVYARDPALDTLDAKVVVGKLCNHLQCTCLISDDTPNPYRWLLIRGENDVTPAFLDPKYFDDEAGSSFVIASQETTVE